MYHLPPNYALFIMITAGPRGQSFLKITARTKAFFWRKKESLFNRKNGATVGMTQDPLGGNTYSNISVRHAIFLSINMKSKLARK